MSIKRYIYLLGLILICGCVSKSPVFVAQPSAETGISFVNKNMDSDTLNIFDYLYYYNGAGVAVGDINNDGLPDIYFVANQGGNKLYLNKGNFKFDDITEKAGVKGNADWSTGVTMADVNGDGWLDMYVCAVASHQPQSMGIDPNAKIFFPHSKNQLYINNHNGTFSEEAQAYGLDVAGYSTQSVFFDYDKDGDLDMFLLQHSIHQTDSYGDTSLRRKYSPVSGCKLFRNDDGKHFSNVTEQSKLISSALGYGLGAACADFNNDGWDDIYVGNDFHENDYYYLNNGDGTFTESIRTAFGYTSNFSMGNDAADFNNDGQMDIMTLDMLPSDEKILKTSLMDESFDEYAHLHQQGYHYQYSKNCLQLNMDNGKHFSETSLYSGVSATDWSWSVLGADFNLDGNKDIFITNGIKRRLNDLDFLKFRSGEAFQFNAEDERKNDNDLLGHLPDAAWHNYFFVNNGNTTFTDESAKYGFDKPSLSNGAAYADLDNDGDLDLVINNMNATAGIFKNNTIEISTKNYLNIKFNGSEKNKFGIGAKVFCFSNNKIQYQQLQTTRGFMSSVEPRLNVGFEHTNIVDSIIVIWPDNKFQKLFKIKTNQQLIINNSDAVQSVSNYSVFFNGILPKTNVPALEDISASTDINWKHNENLSFNDFNVNPFIPHQLSTMGPALAIADVNADGLDDIFVGGAKMQRASIFLQQANGKFISSTQNGIIADSLCEDVKAQFFDADNDRDMDLYVASGGAEFSGKSEFLKDRLYINDGKGNFTRSIGLPDLFNNKGAIAITDFDKDGDADIFVGSKVNVLNYGEIPESYLLQNDGKGNFINIADKIPGLKNVGMVSSATWADLNSDGYPELIIAGEFMAPTIFKNLKGHLSLEKNNDLEDLTGLWQEVYVADVNNDNRPDILLGNYGLNSKLTASEKFPLKLFCKDIDNNQNVDQVLAIAKDGKYFPFLGKETFEKQLPFIKKEFLSYEKMAGKSVEEIFGSKLNGANIFEVNTLASVVLINKGDFEFNAIQLPEKFQWMPLFAFAQLPDRSIVAGGNFFGVLPYEGRYDNSMLPQMKFVNNSMIQTNTYFAQGEVRNMQWINLANGKALVIARNNLPLIIYKAIQN